MCDCVCVCACVLEREIAHDFLCPVCVGLGVYVSATVLFLIFMNLCLPIMYKTQDKIAGGDGGKDMDSKIQVKKFMMANYDKM